MCISPFSHGNTTDVTRTDVSCRVSIICAPCVKGSVLIMNQNQNQTKNQSNNQNNNQNQSNNQNQTNNRNGQQKAQSDNKKGQ